MDFAAIAIVVWLPLWIVVVHESSPADGARAGGVKGRRWLVCPFGEHAPSGQAGLPASARSGLDGHLDLGLVR